MTVGVAYWAHLGGFGYGLLSGLASVFIPLGLFLGSVAQTIVGSNWRLLIALGALPIFLLLWLRKVPESPRFLQSHGRTAEARDALAWALEFPVEQLGALPEIKSVQSASYSIVFSKYLRSLVIITIGLLADKLLFSPWEKFLHRRWGTARN